MTPGRSELKKQHGTKTTILEGRPVIIPALRNPKQRKDKLAWLKLPCLESCHTPLPFSMADYVPRDHLLQNAYNSQLSLLRTPSVWP